MTQSSKGYIFAAMAAASYGTNPIFALPLYHDGMDVTSVLLFRYALAVAILFAVMVVKSPEVIRISPRHLLPVGIMGVLMVLSSIFLFVSYNYMSVGIASTLLFFYPVMVSLIMAVVYKERLGYRQLFCLIVATLGVFILSKGDDGTGISMLGFLLVMLSSLSYAIYLVYINRGPMRHLSSTTVTLWVLIIGFLFLVGQCMLTGGLILPQNPVAWVNAIGLGLFPTVISLYLTSRAIDLIGSTQTAIFGALEPLTAVMLGIIILGETLTIRPAIGMAMIFISVTVLVMQRKR